MNRWLLIVGGAVGAAYAVGRSRERSQLQRLTVELEREAAKSGADTLELDELDDLPPPVARYLRAALENRRAPVHKAQLRQRGVLRTSAESPKWLSFEAEQLVVPPTCAFLWNAKVSLPLATHVRVLDSYHGGTGSGRVSLLSALPIAAESGASELDSGALHRYLAEAVWYPTALLPRPGLEWRAVDDHRAEATLTDEHTTVSLEFRFNDADEVTSIYSSGRFGRFDGEYRKVAWEGHFDAYEERSGMRVPSYGEVGWYAGDTWQPVWEGNLTDAWYD